MYNSKNSYKSSIKMEDLHEIKLSNDEFSLLISRDSDVLTDEVNNTTINKKFINITQATDDFFLIISNNVLLSFDEKILSGPSCIVTNFFQAKSKLINSIKFNFIVIDIPLRMPDLILFKSWIKNSNLRDVPIFYSDRFLQKEQINILFVEKFVDDVIDLEKDFYKLTKKAKFLKNLKHQNNLQAVSEVSKKQFKEGRSALMRFFDIFFALIAIVCFIPVFILIAIVIRWESKGPIFYSSSRTGVGFKIFKFYKFRTMVVDADKRMEEYAQLNIYTSSSGNGQAKFIKIMNDPRVTRVGAFLRNTSLDELPQLFNVLKGDMSIVGNRPLPIYEATTLTTDMWAERFMAPAGITGLWQISKRGNPQMSTEERISLDINYARTRSAIGDLKILIKTPFALRQKANL